MTDCAIPCPPTAPPAPLGDDMVEANEQASSCPELQAALALLRTTLLPQYQAADQLAMRLQRLHRLMAALAAILGTAAVLLSILELGERIPGPLLPGLEVVAVIICSAAVFIGLALSFQRKWLLARHKAERSRLLKFGFITDPEYWCMEANGTEAAFMAAGPHGPGGGKPVTKDKDSRKQKQSAQLEAELKAVRSMTTAEMEDWLKVDLLVENPDLNVNCAVEDRILCAVVGYYRKQRLANQMRFFEDRIQQNRWQRLTWSFPSWLFFGSIVAALLHFILDLAGKPGAEGFILLAAAFPVLGAGIRTYRSTYEFARNAMRYEAKLLALRRIDAGLDEALMQTPPPSHHIFHDLWRCEQIFEIEHREWLRLMLEAEWYG